MRILLAEDDPGLADPLQAFLRREGHQCDWVTDGLQAWSRLQQPDYDLLLLDWMMPGLDGLSLCQQLRAAGLVLPVIMLTARDAQEDVVRGLEGGADDYLVKPVRLRELGARVNAVARRAVQTYGEPLLRWGALQLDPRAGQVSWAAQPVALTARELTLLEYLLRHPGQLFSRVQLLDRVWGLESDAGDETVKTHLNNLRRKLKLVGCPDPVETVNRLGYRLRPPAP